MDWQHIHSAPRDRRVWVYLPAMRWKSDAQGRPSEVEDGIVMAQWQHDFHDHHGAWVNVKTNHPVYPSLWHDIQDSVPEAPKL